MKSAKETQIEFLAAPDAWTSQLETSHSEALRNMGSYLCSAEFEWSHKPQEVSHANHTFVPTETHKIARFSHPPVDITPAQRRANEQIINIFLEPGQ